MQLRGQQSSGVCGPTRSRHAQQRPCSLLPGRQYAYRWKGHVAPVQAASVDERTPSPSPAHGSTNLELSVQDLPADLHQRLAMERALTATVDPDHSNGHSLNGHHANNGHHVNGHAANGHAVNGHAVNGHHTAGHGANGHTSNGHAVIHDASVKVHNAESIRAHQSDHTASTSPSHATGSHGSPVAVNGHSEHTAIHTTHSTPSIVLYPVDDASSSQPTTPDTPQQSQAHQQQHSTQPQQPPLHAVAAAPEAPPQQPQVQVQQQGALDGIPQPILVISFVSACLTMASCVFNTLLPIYMVTELKMNMRSMGMFEGLLEAFSYVVRMFSGVVSDMMTSRKNAITLGFAMGAMAKFGMTGATTVTQLFASKAIDRLANGVQAAPRDALISDLAPAASRSACFGFAQSMRKWGSFLGAALSFFLMRASGNNYQLIFLMAASVTVASTLAFVFLVPSHARPLTPEQQSERKAQELYQEQQAQHAVAAAHAAANGQAAPTAPTPPPKKEGLNPARIFREACSMGSDFYRMLGVISMYGLGHINESMLEARAIEVGFGKAESTLIVALLALVISFAAWPLGQLDDKHGPRVTFAVGMSALIAGNLVLMMSGPHPIAVFASCLFLGVHWAVIQGPLLSVVVSLAPSHLRGMAFGIFYTVMAVVTVVANSIYGTLWHTMGAGTAFSLSAALMVVALVALPYLLPESLRHGSLLKRAQRQQEQQQQEQLKQQGPTPAPA